MHLMTDDSSDLPRRRQASAEALAGREAARFVRELNRQLGAWQASSVKLNTMASRLNAAGRTDPAVVAEANALFKAIGTESRRFESLLPQMPDAVSQHGRIADTRQSFRMVTDRLIATLRLMNAAPPDDRDEGRVD